MLVYKFDEIFDLIEVCLAALLFKKIFSLEEFSTEDLIKLQVAQFING